MNISIVINQIIQLFLIILLGYILFKIDLLDISFNNKLTKLILNVTLPSMILASVLNQSKESDLSEVILVFGVAVILFMFLPLISFILVKTLKIPINQQGIYMFMNTFSNIGFMGFPIISALYGDTAVFYTAIFNLIFNLASFTIGIQMMNYKTSNSSKFSYKNLITPGVIVSLSAIIIYFSHIKLPCIIGNTCSLIGNITTPSAMLLMGASLAKMDLKTIFLDWRVYPFAIIKQVLLPILLFPFLKLLIKNDYILGITLLMLIMPVANNSILFATEFNNDDEVASKTVFITTLLSILTIPLIMYICLR